jgi:diguanylate cyclase (GGDEF)-like protein
MNHIILLIELVFLLMGALFLIRSLSPINRLISELPEGGLKKRWTLLSTLILYFLLFYVVFGYSLWISRESITILSIVGSLMMLLGGCFAYLVGQLALQTANDVKDLAILQHESITDALTGLKNRRYFNQRISEEVALSKRYKLPLSLILIDVDHFKKINDTFGHQIGDDVLTNLSKLIQETVRDSDIVARYGGEEIAIITPNTAKAEAERLAERLRLKIEKTTVAIVETTQEVVQVTISAGICSLSAVITDHEALLEESDQALYLAKKYGRNRVIGSNW